MRRRTALLTAVYLEIGMENEKNKQGGRVEIPCDSKYLKGPESLNKPVKESFLWDREGGRGYMEERKLLNS